MNELTYLLQEPDPGFLLSPFQLLSVYYHRCSPTAHAAGLPGHSFSSGVNHVHQTTSLLHTGGYFIYVFQCKPTPGLRTLAGSQATARKSIKST